MCVITSVVCSLSIYCYNAIIDQHLLVLVLEPSTRAKRTKKLPDFSDNHMDFEPSNSKSAVDVSLGSEELD